MFGKKKIVSNPTEDKLVLIEKTFNLPSISNSFHDNDRIDLLIRRIKNEEYQAALGMLALEKSEENITKAKNIHQQM
jgi:hypothetical protein